MNETKILKRSDSLLHFTSFTRLISSKQRQHKSSTPKETQSSPKLTKTERWKNKKHAFPCPFSFHFYLRTIGKKEPRLWNRGQHLTLPNSKLNPLDPGIHGSFIFFGECFHLPREGNNYQSRKELCKYKGKQQTTWTAVRVLALLSLVFSLHFLLQKGKISYEAKHASLSLHSFQYFCFESMWPCRNRETPEGSTGGWHPILLAFWLLICLFHASFFIIRQQKQGSKRN